MDRKPVICRVAALVGISNLPNQLTLPLNRWNAESMPQPTGDVKVLTAK